MRERAAASPASALRAAFRSDLAKRLASAAVLAPIALAAAIAGGAPFAALIAFAGVIMLFEWSRMVEGRDFSLVFVCAATVGAIAIALAAARAYPLAFMLCALAALGCALASLRGARRPLWAGFGPLYIAAPCVALIWLRGEHPNGLALTLMLQLVVWAADTGGYVGGRLVGGPKMNPAVSPAKTWAGVVGGVLFGAGAGLGVAWLVFEGRSYGAFALAGASLGLASILGDVAESAFKRVFGVKDVSGFIPGHGGVLDRVDGMIFATAAMTLALFFHMVIERWQG